MRFIVLLLFFSPFVAESSQHEEFVFQQRGIMMSQLQYEMNLDLMLMDPANCSIPVIREDRIRVLKANIATLEREGAFSHCSGPRFVGSRKIVRDLEEQKKSVIQMETTFRAGKEGITVETGGPGQVSATEGSAAIDPVDNSRPKEEENITPMGSLPSALPILSGYAGVPYSLSAEIDETFGYSYPGSSSYYRSKNLPQGLTIANTKKGVISGVPAAAGLFTPNIDVGWIGLYGVRTQVYFGPVKLKIYPKPKFTVLNSMQRDMSSKVSFNSQYPLLGVTFKHARFPDFVRAINGVTRGKRYFEVKIGEIGGSLSAGFGVKNVTSFNETKFYGLVDAKPGSTYLETQDLAGNKIERKFKSGDVLMFAIDADTRPVKLWKGVNGIWSGPLGKPGDDRLKPVNIPDPQIANAPVFWPEFHGHSGASVIVNFGDQTWDFPPPSGFTGIPYQLTETIPNMWDSNTASPFMMSDEFWRRGLEESNMNSGLTITSYVRGQSAVSSQAYVIGDKGDAILSMSPKKSGRWQFEMRMKGFPGKTQFGLAPANFDTFSYKKLGAAGTGSIGFLSLDETMSMTGKGAVDVDGVRHYLPETYSDETRYTFDCDFDGKRVTIFADGKKVFESSLPANPSSQWVIATTSASTETVLYSLLEEMKYPVKGVKAWSFEGTTCSNCGGPVLGPAVAEKTCASASFVSGGSPATAENMSLACALPETKVGRQANCHAQVPVACMNLGNGKFYCSPTDTFIIYPSQEECDKTCTGIFSVYKTCKEDGWKNLE